MRIAKRMDRLGTETAFEVLAEVKRLEQEGKDIVSFALGEPDFDTPDNIKKAGIDAINDNYTHYGPSAGMVPLREAVANYVSATRKMPVDPDEVVVMPGAKPIVFHGMLACVDEGDEVVYPNPGYPIYESIANFLGAKCVPLPLLEEREFTFNVEDLRACVTPRTKMIVLNSPQNPTGGVLTKKDLEAVAELALEYDIWVISDEVYCKILYGEDFVSIATIPEMKERTIIVDGVSKSYAMTGWRLGFGVMNKELATHVARLETNCESCTASFTQLAAAEALNGPQDVSEAMVREFKERRDLIVNGLNDIEGISCLRPKGTFYVFPNVTEACRNKGFRNAKGLQVHLLHNAGVAVLPRTSFGVRNQGETEEYIRLSYATSKENIREGLKRIKQAIEGRA